MKQNKPHDLEHLVLKARSLGITTYALQLSRRTSPALDDEETTRPWWLKEPKPIETGKGDSRGR